MARSMAEASLCASTGLALGSRLIAQRERFGEPFFGRVVGKWPDSLQLVTAAHLPHYTSTDVITGTVIFVALLVIFAVAALRRR
jgi:hypothetical protein